MRILVVGSGGREHALVWKIAQSPFASRVFAAPGSEAMSELAHCVADVSANDLDGICALAREEDIDLVVVGPEDPLAAGLADRLREMGVACFGPGAYAAQLEASKSFAKAFMGRHQIPTADYEVFDTYEAARRYVREHDGPCVVKADGLAAGKGVTVCDDGAQAERALAEVMREGRFGEAGARVVIEERMVGEEVSYYALCDGSHVVTLAAAQDHKRALDGDRGENTGGMGAYSPAPVLTEAIEKRVLEAVVHPALQGMAAEGHPYVGVLFVGLMIEAGGTARVVEFNVRFGDPETQALLVRMESDLLPLLDAAARGTLARTPLPEWNDAAVCVVLASGGYPREYAVGKRIAGLDALGDGVVVFHAGTARDESGAYVTKGGRVLGVTARGSDIRAATTRAYEAVDRVRFDGAHCRRDIAARALGGVS